MSSAAEKALDDLIEHHRRIALLWSARGTLGWDERTYLPAAAAEYRADQVAFLTGLEHDMITDQRVNEWLSEIENSDLVADPDSIAAVNVREIRWQYDRQTKVPKSLVEAITHAESVGQRAWLEAKAASDFSILRPHLEKMTLLKREYADAVGYEDTVYDALLEDYEAGLKTSELARVMDDLRHELVPLVERLLGAERRPDISIIRRDYPVERQRYFVESAAAAIGFNFSAGRLDISPHPFCATLGPCDCRITTRYLPDNFAAAFFDVMHEAGHGLYEQGYDQEHFGTPLAWEAGLGVHESQSRMWENSVARSRPFWQHFFPRAQQAFPTALGDVNLDDFYFALNEVSASLIRIDADEVTYNLHILARFEIEQAVFSDDLQLGDIPACFNEKLEEYLGIRPKNDAEGCLQDIHWGRGIFGYFPTYALGNLYAAQFFAKASQELGDLDEQFARGDFSGLLSWLRENIHRRGRRYRSPELVKTVTGKPLAAADLINSLQSKYLPLYGLA